MIEKLQGLRPVIMDVDTGVDDALAIMMAVKCDALRLLGITTVSGNVSLSQATLNTRKILFALEQERLNTGEIEYGDVPVIPGADRPMLRPLFFEHHVHGRDGLGGALHDVELPPLPGDLPHAASFIIEQAKTYHGELELIMTAPLTNLAIAVRMCPELPKLIRRVVIMGGVVGSFGNVTPTAEYNMYVDPEAARIVLQAGFELTMVGLDVTRKALLSEEHLQELDGTELGPIVRQCTKDYMDRYRERNGINACALHDPLAVGAAIDPTLVVTKKLYVDVETKSELCDGQTVCDFQNRLGHSPNVNVCLDVDSERFIRQFIGLIKQ
ncbi:nucleoside hydrolase [Paenibacillus sp. ACRRX]|uniref:nucleoside hydrolase n=1 Tax=Paenibacillus sp. ACRRX TaxID=2918206 RepID=UPI001EF5BCB6|nr:nucleoside hydrolase [Paenibacillus sp. ACRRX]MCG7408407.1 nucleoside hydrolase [Paenibacillus sp. ACRRX]